MQQYFGIKKENNIIYLNSSDNNHIKNVMRMKEGNEVIIVFNNRSYLCSLNKELLSAEIIRVYRDIEKDLQIIMYIPVLVDEKMSFIFQKGTELGVTKFIPVEFINCKYRLKNEIKEKKVLRWNKITKEASEQCHRLSIPKVENIISYKDIESQKGVNIVCSLDNEDVKPINEVLNSDNICDKITLVFGPEGGITKEEEKLIEGKGFTKTSLGQNILRSETVPLYLASVIQFLKLGEKK